MSAALKSEAQYFILAAPKTWGGALLKAIEQGGRVH